MDDLLTEIRACTACQGKGRDLPLGPRPIFQAGSGARILIAGQAPGRVAHGQGRPFDDLSGDRLRDWLGIDRETFYDASRIALVPMGFCYPGTEKGADLPPRSECAPLWRARLLAAMPHIELTVLLGRYALNWHLPDTRGKPLTDAVTGWRETFPRLLPLVHPSPRNIGWLKRNPWFETETVPALRSRVAETLGVATA